MNATILQKGRFPTKPLRVDDPDSGVSVEFDVVSSSVEPFRISVTGQSGRRTEFRFDVDGNETGSETIMNPTMHPPKGHNLRPKLRVVR